MKASLGSIPCRMLGVIMLALAGLALSAGGASAVWVSLGGSEGAEVDVVVLESSNQRTLIEYTLPGFHAEPIDIEGRKYYDLQLSGESNRLDPGMPELPHICRSVIIPDSKKMEVRILDIDFEEIAGYPVAPSKGNLPRSVNPPDVPYRFDPIYGADVWYPEQIVLDRAPYILRDYRGMVVDVTPFQAHGPDGGLRVARHFVVEVIAEGPGVQNTIDRAEAPSTIAKEFGDLYRHHFINWGGQRYVPVEEKGPMLVITYDAFYDVMVPFVEWKKQQGIPTEMINVSEIGNNQTVIDATIEQAYLNDGIAFVLLVGDAAQVASYLLGGNESDPTYSLIVGSDSYPDLFIGRFSAETPEHAQTQVDRTIAYEKTPMAGAAWYHKGTGIASNQGPGDDGEYDNQHQDVIRQKLLDYGYTEVDQIYDPSGTAAMVTAALNAGRSTVNYTGHGSTTSWSSTGFSNSHVNALTNDHMLPFITSVACVNGDFGGTTCFAEAWLRATNGGNPTGAIGTYMASINQSWDPPMCAQDEAIDLLVGDEMHTFGSLCYNGSCQMMDEYGASGVNEFNHWHVFGDPSVLVRTKTPTAMMVQHDGAMFIGMESYSVMVSGVEDALCALYADGVLYGAAYSEAGGTAVIPIDPPLENPVTLTLTVTGYNKIPVIEPVEVLPPDGPFLVFSDHQILDPYGDHDGLCDAGEADGLLLHLTNVGVDPATGVTAAISTEDPYVTITVDEQAIEDILPDSTGGCIEPFAIEVDPNTPDAHSVLFHIDITSNEGDWECNFNVPVQAPVLAAGRCMIDDSPPWGDGNGTADPGDSLLLQLGLPNVGHSDAWDLTGTLSCLHPGITVVGDRATCLQAPFGGEGVLSTFRLLVQPGCSSPCNIDLQVSVSAGNGFAAEVNYTLSVGSFADNAEADLGWTLGAAGDGASTGLWIRAEPVGTTYEGQPCQPEDDHTLDPGTICFVTGNGSVGGAAGEEDVDGGKTTLLTPVFPLEGAISATIEYWRWYTNNLGNNPGQDYWDVDVTSNGSDWVHLEHTMESANSWIRYTFEVGDYVPLTDQVQIRFVADDTSPGSLVEAAVDDFVLTAVREPVTEVSVSEIREANGLISCHPNPFNPRMQVVYRVDSETRVRMDLYDLSGRMVRCLVDGAVAAGQHSIAFDGVDGDGRALSSGIYFLRLETPEILQVRQLTLLK